MRVLPLLLFLALAASRQATAATLYRSQHHSRGRNALEAPAAPAPPRTGGAATGITHVHTSWSYDPQAVDCDTWSGSTYSSIPAQKWVVSGTPQPAPPADVQALVAAACKIPSSAGAVLVEALEAGGARARAVADAVFESCPASGEQLVQLLADHLNPPGQPNFERTKKYVALYAQAAEQAGKATCTTVTGFDADPHAAGAAARVLSEETFHPATPAPASSATTTGTASAGAPGSGIGTSTGSDAGTGSGSGTGAGASGGTIDHIRTSIQIGRGQVQCEQWSPATSWSQTGDSWESSTTSPPEVDEADVQALVSRLCADPATAGQALAEALLGGGPAAQVALQASTESCPATGQQLYHYWIEFVNPSGEVMTDLGRVQKYGQPLVDAADSLGWAFCLAYVPVDAAKRPVGPTLTLHPPKPAAAAAVPAGTTGMSVLGGVPAGPELRF